MAANHAAERPEEDNSPPEFFRDVLRPRLMPWIVRSSVNEVPAFQQFFGVYPRPHTADEPDKHAIIDQCWRDPDKPLFYRAGSAIAALLAAIGSFLGSEMYYIMFLPCLFWTIDTALGRHVVWFWSFSMYVGQAIKDHLRLPRPSVVNHAVRVLERDFHLEYGFPSTHVLSVFAQSSMVVYFTYEEDYNGEHNYPLAMAVSIAGAFVAVTAFARLYHGVHTTTDLLGGLLLSVGCLLVYTSFHRSLDAWVVSSRGAFILPTLFGSLFLAMYPRQPGVWVISAYEDTAIISGVANGVTMASYLVGRTYERVPLPWLNASFWPWLGLAFARAILGFLFMALVRAVMKKLCATFVPRILQLPADEERHAITIPSKFITYTAVGFSAVFTVPLIFEAVGLTIDILKE